MAKIKFYLDTRRTKDNELSILKLSVNHSGKVAYISLDRRLRAESWNAKKEKVREKKHPDALAINTYLTEIRQLAENILIQLTREGKLKDMTVMELRDYIWAELDPERKEKEPEIKNSFERRYRLFIENKKPKTKECYEHTLGRIKAYLETLPDKSLSTLTFEDITLDWLNSFNTFMAKTSPSENARNVHFRNMRAVFNNAIENDETTHYPFRKFKIKTVETEKRSLTVEELRRLFFFPCESFLDKYRDMFKLMFYLMGVNMIDLLQLTEIKNGRLNFNRSKTGHLYAMKVEPEAAALFKLYKGEKYLLNVLDHWGNHEFFRRKMNKELQKIGPMTKKPGRGGKKEYTRLFPNITSYWARHSWATIASEIDVPNEVIAEALGHEYGNKITNIYIRKNQKKVDEANRKVLDWVLYGKINGVVVCQPGTPAFFGLKQKKAVELGLVKPAPPGTKERNIEILKAS